jgi:hypothetical protein
MQEEDGQGVSITVATWERGLLCSDGDESLNNDPSESSIGDNN